MHGNLPLRGPLANRVLGDAQDLCRLGRHHVVGQLRHCPIIASEWFATPTVVYQSLHASGISDARRNLANRAGYRILRWYEAHGLTGTESSKRKGFQKLLADAKSGAFCAVLLSEQSRMLREDVFDATVIAPCSASAGIARA